MPDRSRGPAAVVIASLAFLALAAAAAFLAVWLGRPPEGELVEDAVIVDVSESTMVYGGSSGEYETTMYSVEVELQRTHERRTLEIETGFAAGDYDVGRRVRVRLERRDVGLFDPGHVEVHELVDPEPPEPRGR